MNQKLKIAQIAPLWIPVPPLTYGGTELIVSLLTENLAKRGNKVTLFATGDSKTRARLISIWEKSLWRAKLNSPHAVWGLMFNKLLNTASRFDVLHNHTGFYISPFVRFFEKPVVTTIHRPISPEMLQNFRMAPEVNYVAISKDQKRSAPKMKFASVIYNGIDTKKYHYRDHADDYVLWLSKIIPEKGIIEAIEVAKMAKERLIIAGNIPPDDSRFFRYEVLPRIDGDQIKYVGPADFKKKIQLLRHAKALLFPVSRREPFGLVVAEAQACGTPVVAYPSGAMPELIQSGRTGFLAKSNLEMALALKRIDRIKRSHCRKFIKEHFDAVKMVDAYEKLYKSLL
ncbi:MAG: glycosyltransferase family 4 protein [bacterium]|nr:glycosyltransferase family 4 protein [bacterium]